MKRFYQVAHYSLDDQRELNNALALMHACGRVYVSRSPYTGGRVWRVEVSRKDFGMLVRAFGHAG